MRASLPDSRLLPLPDMKPDVPAPSAGAGPVAALLLQASLGDRAAMDQLFPLVYDQLRRMARSSLRRERSGHTLGTTGLVHEAYLKLVDQTRVGWRDRAHFFAVAALAMRRILVDYARRHRRAKRGGGANVVTPGRGCRLAR